MYPSAVLSLVLAGLPLAPPGNAPPPRAAKADPAPTPAVLSIAGDTKVDAYKLVRLSATGTDPKAGLIWRVTPAVDKATPSAKDRIEFVAPPGTYAVDVLAVKLAADGSTDIQEATATVTIGGGPAPPQPPPPDAFSAAVRGAYLGETAADKQKSTLALASLYRTAAGSTVADTTVTTYGQLFADLKSASAALLPPAAIPAVRKAVGDRLNKTLGAAAATPIDRALARSEFLAVASALEGATK